jgi:2-methylcitrate dehydratase PrpD
MTTTRKSTLSLQLFNAFQQIRNRPLPQSVEHKAKCCIIDFLAASFGAASSESTVIAGNIVAQLGKGACTLLGRRQKASPLAACLYNGMVSHAEELDDSHRYVSGLHLGAVVIPPALAIAEERELDGSSFLTAVVCGYEIAGRICRCIDQAHRARGFHSTGTVGPFGACAAAAASLNFDEQTFLNAIGITASTAAGLFAFLENGATVKHFHPGRAAFDGLLCALLAQQGLTGPNNVFEAREGFFRAYADSYDPAPLYLPLESYEITCAYHKMHSSCGHSFPAIDAALELRRQIEACWKDIAKIEFGTYRAAAVLSNQRPKNLQEVRFSIPMLTALALVHGSVNRSDLTDTIIGDNKLLNLAARVFVYEEEALQATFPRLRAGILKATLRSGQMVTISINAPRGMPDNPVSFTELCNKFKAESAEILSPTTQQTIIDAVMDVDNLSSIRHLSQLLAPSFEHSNG